MEWFEERLHANWRQGIRVKEVLYREHTELQDLVDLRELRLGPRAGAGRRGPDHDRRRVLLP